MIDLGLYNRLGRTDQEIIDIGVEDCNRILPKGFIAVRNKPYGVDVRFYEEKPTHLVKARIYLTIPHPIQCRSGTRYEH